MNGWGMRSLDLVGNAIPLHTARVFRAVLPLRSPLRVWCKLLPVLFQNGTLGELRLCLAVPIRTGLGTMLNTGECVLWVSILWNFTGVELGTW